MIEEGNQYNPKSQLDKIQNLQEIKEKTFKDLNGE